LLMSMMVKKIGGDYVCIFFTERKLTTVPKSQTKMIFEVIEKLSPSYNITEIIFVTPVVISLENNLNSIFTQVFKDTEIMALCRKKSAYSPTLRPLTSDQRSEFEKVNTYVTARRIQQIKHTDPVIKFLGIRPNTIVEIIRTPVFPGMIQRKEFSYAYVF